MTDKSLQLLGIAKKAGLLAVGGEDAAASARRGKAKLLITASDASEGTVRRAKANAESGGARYIAVPFTKFELGNITGRGSPGTIAFLDKGLADGFEDRLAEIRATGRPEDPGPTDRPPEPEATDRPPEPGAVNRPPEPGYVNRQPEPGATDRSLEAGSKETLAKRKESDAL